jgi:hypothetical protein
MADTTSGADLIAAERARQVEVEGWTPEHDAEHAGAALALAACCYALPPQMRKWKQVPKEYRASGRWQAVTSAVPTLWPWDGFAWKDSPEDRVRELVKAGALIAAEIDRLQAEGR